jgi:serine protease Do
MIRNAILAATCVLATADVHLFAQNGGNRPVDYCDLKPSIDAIESVRVLSADTASALERKVQRAYAMLAPSIVRIRYKSSGGSGVIVEEDGLILTASHLGLPPHGEVTVELSDGRNVPGVALGRFALNGENGKSNLNPGPDLGLVRITQKGKWPAALVDPLWLPKGAEICLAIGYPGALPPHSPPLLRLGRLLPPVPRWRTLRTTTSVEPGDSGGPLFDLEGRVLGIASGPRRYEPLEPFHRYRKQLLGGQIVSAPQEPIRAREASPANPGAFVPALDVEDKVLHAATGVVHILNGAAEIALGWIVHRDGYVVTKRSLVLASAQLKCRMRFKYRHTKMVYAARVVAQSPNYDLALLKFEAKGIPTIPWSTQPDTVSVGRMVATLGIEPVTFGVVGSNISREPALANDVPQIAINVKAGPRGEVLLTGFWEQKVEMDPFRDLLEPGDVLTHVNGVPTPTTQALGGVADHLIYASREPNGPVDYARPAENSFIGDPVTLTIRRNGGEVNVSIIKVSSVNVDPFSWYRNPCSLRRAGFPAVFAHDGRIAPQQCGGPVVNLAGEVVGLNIARADDTRTLAIPVDVLKETVDHLLAEAKARPVN